MPQAKYTAPSTADIYYVTATSVADPSKWDTVPVVVEAPDDSQEPSLILSPIHASVEAGQSVTFSVSASDGSNVSAVSWFATIGSLTGSGTSRTWYSGLLQGQGMIVVSLDHYLIGTAPVTVNSPSGGGSGLLDNNTCGINNAHTWGKGNQALVCLVCGATREPDSEVIVSNPP